MSGGGGGGTPAGGRGNNGGTGGSELNNPATYAEQLQQLERRRAYVDSQMENRYLVFSSGPATVIIERVDKLLIKDISNLSEIKPNSGKTLQSNLPRMLVKLSRYFSPG